MNKMDVIIYDEQVNMILNWLTTITKKRDDKMGDGKRVIQAIYMTTKANANKAKLALHQLHHHYL